MTLSSSASLNSVYLAALSQVSQLVSANAETFDAEDLLEQTYALRDHLEAEGIAARRFSSTISLFQDLAGDRMLRPETAQAVWLQTQTDPAAALVPGFDRFDPIGWGGFGVVYWAYNEETGRQAAVKVGRLTPKGASTDSLKRAATIEGLIEVYEKEYDFLSRLRGSEHIVQVEAQGRTQRGKPYFELEFVGGGSLSQLLKRIENGEIDFTWKRIYNIVDQMLEGACAVHQAGIIHGDFKPENYLVGRQESLKLADFSLAMEVTEAKKRGSGSPRGTNGYLPIQTTESLSSDVHRLGGTVYKILTGRTPVIQDNQLGALAQFVLGCKPPSERRPERNIPPELDRFVMKALNRDPSARFKDAMQMQTAFRKLKPVLLNDETPSPARRSPSRASSRRHPTRTGR